MAADREAMEQELAELKELRQLKAQRAAEKSGLTLHDLAQSFNKGMVDLATFPADLLNIPLGLVGAPQFRTDQTRQMAADAGLTAQPGQERKGFLPRTAEILGASVLPGMGIQKAGADVLRRGIPEAQRTVTQQLTATTAQSPGKAAALDIASSFGAGGGGEIASNLSDSPTTILLGELAGGFTFPLVTAASRIAGSAAGRGIKSAVVPFTKAGAEPRASNRLRGLSADPAADAQKIDISSPISPARQTGNPRLIALEKVVLTQNPELEAKFSDDLKSALAAAKDEAANFGGTDRTRDVLQSGQEHLIELVNLRAAQAAQKAQSAIDALGGKATPRDVSRIARDELEMALKDVRQQETELWNAVGKDAPAEFNNAAKALFDLRAETSDRVPVKVPKWLSAAVGKARPATLDDLQQVRSKVLADARLLTRQGKFGKARPLNLVAEALLKDMAEVDGEGVQTALAYSRSLNQKFSEGAVAEILNRGARKGAGIAAEDTLAKLFSGRTPATNVKEFLAASPDSEQQLQQFIKSEYVARVSKGGRFLATASDAEIAKLESQGMFEIFPNLKKELSQVQGLFQKSENLASRAATVTERGGSRLSKDDQRSLAGVLLGADPGEEMSVLLQSDNAVDLAAALHRRMGGNKDAINGLKTSFVDAIFKASSKNAEVSGERMAAIINDNMKVAAALGMDAADITRVRYVARRIIQAQTPPGAAETKILADKPAMFMSFVATLAGAKVGQRIAGSGLGSSLKVASAGSDVAGKLLNRLTTDKAQKMLIDAMSDPVLFKALLTKSNATQQDAFRASRVIESWIIGAGIEASETQTETP